MPSTAPIKVPILGVDEYSKAFKKMTKRVAKIGRAVEATGKKMTTHLTVPIVGLGVMSARTAIAFDDAMRKVAAKATEAGVSIAELRTQAKNLGSETRYTASQAAEGMDFLAMAGWDTKQIYEGLPSILNLAAAASVDLGQSADVTSNIMGAFGIKTNDTQRVVDTMAATLTGANVDLEEYSDSMKYASAVAKTYGMSLEDTSAAVGFLGNIGIKGSQAGTVLKRVMLNIATGAGGAADELKKLKIQTADSEGNLVSFVDIMGQLAGAYKGMGQQDIMKSMGSIFGARSIAGAAGMIGDLQRGENTLTKLVKNINSIQPGKTKAMAELMEGGAGGSWRRFVSAFESIQIAIMESGVLDKLAGLMTTLADKMRLLSKQDPEFLFGIAKGLGALALLGPALMIVGKAVSLAAGLASAIGAAGGLTSVLAVATGPIGWVIAGITALIGVVIYCWDAIKELRDAISGPFINIFNDFIGAFTQGEQKATGLGEGLRKLVGFVTRLIAPVVNLGLKFIMWPLKAVTKALRIAVSVFRSVFNVIRIVIGAIRYAYHWLKNLIVGWLESSAAGRTFLKVIDWIVGGLRTVWETVKEVWGYVEGFFSSIADFLGSVADDIENAADKQADLNTKAKEFKRPDDFSMDMSADNFDQTLLMNMEQQSREADINIKLEGIPEGMRPEVTKNKGGKLKVENKGGIMEPATI